MIKIAISGAGGRMGQRLLALSDADESFELVQAIEWSGFPLLGKPVNSGANLAPRAGGIVWTDALVDGADVLIDFSSPENAVRNAELAARFNTALVIGTTGLDADQEHALAIAAEAVPVMKAPNFSLGVNLMFKLAAEAATVLGDDYNIEIVEAHHNQKVDAPSGTALGIAKAVAAPLGRTIPDDLVNGRVGKPGKRTTREIGMHALRMGALAGEHTVHFCNDFECISITHRTESRDVFVSGALRAAKWIVGKNPRMYSMQDMLFG
ncbi:MAG: 4-hydroxy-tetrahydrodipicolinate reductase [Planctomycetaceae bacterium]|nr:4-hydroxy-tetrahydrodipicolinate reductase [Planctomycetaceae bacterium]